MKPQVRGASRVAWGFPLLFVWFNVVMIDDGSGDETARGLDEILTDLGTVYLRMTEPDLTDNERADLQERHTALRSEAAAARAAMPFDRERARRRITEIERRIEDARARHMDPSTAAVGESGGGGIDAHMLITINTRIDTEAGIDELRSERQRLLDRLAES